MKRKRLNIVFFSILMIAATPRVMTNFNGYADALYQKAESEWLHFLLTFTQAEESDEGTATPAQTLEESACPLRAAKVNQSVDAKPSIGEKKISRSFKSRDRSLSVASAIKPTTPSDVEMEPVADNLRINAEARRHANRIITLLDDPAVVERNGRSKAEFLRVLIRSMKLGDGKAMRALEREITAIERPKSPSIVAAPVSFEWATKQSTNAEPNVVVDEIRLDHQSSEDSTLDAR